MPLYEYECNDCGHRFERIQKFSDPLVSSCPVCDGEVRKLLSSPAIQFKGTGWYVTDYAQKPSGEARDGGDAKSGDAKEGAKQDGSAKGANGKDAGASASKDSSSTSKTESTSSATRSTSNSAAAR